MSDPKAAWLPDWQSMQKQFFSAWTDAARGGAAPSMPVHEGFDVWLKLFNGRDSGNEVLDRVVGSAKQFADFMQGVIGQLATTKPEFSTPAGVREALEKAFGGMGVQKNPVIDALRAVSSEGAKGFEDLFREFMKVAKPLENDARSLMSLPAFGYNRESQERQQALMQAMVDYNDQMNRYNTLMYKASRLGLDRFESKLAERSEPGREITSLRGLYDVFVDAAEEGYAEVALSDEFREAYGALVNSQMRVRQMVQGEVERSTAALGIPGRTELDSVHKRNHEMRRRIAELEERLARLEGASLAPPVAAESAAAEPPAPATKKPVAPKSVKAKAAKPAAATAPKSSTRRSRS
ncbi:MAG: hypothetical protein JNL89_04590 [Rhodanobacteraceae bacterium]|nr:hypothetical protein [Rhodanobacteraceae bacterium]